MRHWPSSVPLGLATLLVLALGSDIASQDRKPAAPLAHVKSIFLGWMDITSVDLTASKYKSEEEWAKVIDENNRAFQNDCRKRLRGYRLTAARNREDIDASGHDVHVQFLDVRWDSKKNWLYVNVRFADPMTGAELLSLPLNYGGFFAGFSSEKQRIFMAMDSAATRLAKEIKRR